MNQAELESGLFEFIENAPVGIFRTRYNGMISLANLAFVRMLGYANLQALNQVPLERLYVDDVDFVIWAEHLNQFGIIQNFEARLACCDGSVIWVEMHGRVIKNRFGELECFEGVVVDVSARKAAEVYLEKLTVDLEESFEQTINSISRMMDRRDPYTAIHQRRVAELARNIAINLGLHEDQIRGIYFGSLIHDVGKFFVPLEYLCYTGPLGKTEMELIRQHTYSGYEVVKNISSRWPIADMVMQHHERLNGTGYPQGLMRGKLEIESRIVAVADCVEAIAGHRPYRPSLGEAHALDVITKGRDSVFDGDVVNSCLHLFREKGYKIEHGEYSAWVGSGTRKISVVNGATGMDALAA